MLFEFELYVSLKVNFNFLFTHAYVVLNTVLKNKYLSVRYLKQCYALQIRFISNKAVAGCMLRCETILTASSASLVVPLEELVCLRRYVTDSLQLVVIQH